MGRDNYEEALYYDNYELKDNFGDNPDGNTNTDNITKNILQHTWSIKKQLILMKNFFLHNFLR